MVRHSGHFRKNGERRRDGIGQVRGALVFGAKLNDSFVRSERRYARSVRLVYGELPRGWTTLRAAWLDLSRAAYERMLYRNGSYQHVPYALARPSQRGRA
jgi:hypothetical protein